MDAGFNLLGQFQGNSGQIQTTTEMNSQPSLRNVNFGGAMNGQLVNNSELGIT